MARKVMQRIYDSEGKLVSKECSKCHKIKSVSEFHKCERNADGLQTKCKECRNENDKKYRQENKDKIKEKNRKFYQENKDEIGKRQRKYRQENPGYLKEYGKKYRQENPDYFKKYRKEYYQKNSAYIKECSKKRRQENPDYFKEYRQENPDKIKEWNEKYRNKQIQEALQQIKIELESNPGKYNYIEGKEPYGIIYLVHNVKSNKYYVGQTTIGFDNRYPSGWLYEHGRKNSVKHDLQLYGKESFKFTKLFKVAHSQYELDKLEAYYIDYYDSYENGYNENRGYIFTDRGKEK